MACVALLVVLKADIRRVLPKMICAGSALFFAILAVLAGIISTDFNKYFIIFHHIFFNNDLWMLNPDTDLLINIVPEPFFMDTARALPQLTAYRFSQYLQFVSLSCIIEKNKNIAGSGSTQSPDRLFFRRYRYENEF